VLSPELVLVTPELRASACAALPPYPPYPPRAAAAPYAAQHHGRVTQVAAYAVSATARTTVWGVGVAGTFAAIAVVAHFV
jgi:hypothetical protein